MNASARRQLAAVATATDCGRIDALEPGRRALDDIRTRLAALSDGFALAAQRAEILATYDAIFRRSLDFPLGACPRASRLTEDGTPIQFATVVGALGFRLRFVGDPGHPGETGAARMRTAHAAVEEVAGIIGTSADLAAIDDLLGILAPESERATPADPAGIFWIGAAFAPGTAAQMRIYINGNLGRGTHARPRMAALAEYFGQSRIWLATEARLPAALSPLGMALTLAPGRAVKGALYFRAFGLRLREYSALAQTLAGAENAKAIDAFGTMLLGEDAHHPTTSAILSVGFDAEAAPTVDLEFCCHCLFRDDTDARRRLLALFSAADVDAGPYTILAEHLLSDAPQPGPPRVHSFIGVDAKSASPTFTVYMKPDLAPGRWSI